MKTSGSVTVGEIGAGIRGRIQLITSLGADNDRVHRNRPALPFDRTESLDPTRTELDKQERSRWRRPGVPAVVDDSVAPS